MECIQSTWLDKSRVYLREQLESLSSLRKTRTMASLLKTIHWPISLFIWMTSRKPMWTKKCWYVLSMDMFFTSPSSSWFIMASMTSARRPLICNSSWLNHLIRVHLSNHNFRWHSHPMEWCNNSFLSNSPLWAKLQMLTLGQEITKHCKLRNKIPTTNLTTND